MSDDITDEEVKTWGTREDGTPKDRGFFGKVPRKDGTGFSTELSRSRGVDGKKLFYPLIVPTLTYDELHHTVNDGESDVVEEKALAHALKRIKEGKSPFAGKGEQRPQPKSAAQDMQEGYGSE